MARPQIKLDVKQVEALAGIGCTTAEIASVLGCSPDTLDRRFAAELAKGRDNMKMRLRKAQLDAALGGNVTMQIWLGKQMLGQKDSAELEHSGEVKIVMVDATSDKETD
jgi:AraC-like DNA-binding protein